MSWKHFKHHEFSCKHCGENKMEDSFVDKLDALREECGFPLRLTSAYRCPEHNMRVSTTGPDGPHTTGRAVDIAVRGPQAYRVVALAAKHGFTGIGVHQKGAVRFIHLDDLFPPLHPRPNVWSY
jgi:uncharacterized protein YcbK (DUF882 family)